MGDNFYDSENFGSLDFFEFQPNSLILAPRNKLYEEDLYIDTCYSCDFRLRRD